MKKIIEKSLDEEKNKRKLSDEVIKKITYRVISNAAICISFVIVFFSFIIAEQFLDKFYTINILKACSIIFLIYAITLMEIAYKKDSEKCALSGIEILMLSVATLFFPYVLYQGSRIILYILITITTLYYIAKIIRISNFEKKQYILGVSDIPEIIKKESHDEMAKKEIEKNEKQRELLKKQKKEEELKKIAETENEIKQEAEKTNKKKTVKNDNETEKKKSTKSKTGTTKKTAKDIEKEPIQKKKTTRKKKETSEVEVKETKTSKKAEDTIKKVDSTTHEQVTTEVKRKRGRPRKNKVSE